MESTFSVPAQLAFLSAIPFLVALGLLAVCLVVARSRGGGIGFVSSCVAAAATAPTLACFLGVRHTIHAFGEMSIHGGGIGSAAAGMWEASQPLSYSLYGAAVLLLIPLAWSLKAAVSANPHVGTHSHSARIAAVAILVGSVVCVAVTTVLFHGVSKLILAIIDPRAPELIPVGQVSQLIASRLMIAAGAAVVATFLLAGASLVGLFVGTPGSSGEPKFARALVALVALTLLLMVPVIRRQRSWTNTLHETALSGQVPHRPPN